MSEGENSRVLIHFEEKDGSVFFGVRVVPRASKSEIAGELDGALKVRLCSPPVDGAANAELIKLLARSLGVSRGYVGIVAGERSKAKRIRINGVTVEELRSRLARWNHAPTQ